MSSQNQPQIDGPGADIQPEDMVDEFSPEEPDDFDDQEYYCEPAPEPALSDAAHDRLIVLIAAIFAVAALVLFFGITQLATTGIFGADCGPIPTNRTARCYQPGFPNHGNDYYSATPVWTQPHSTTIP